MLPLMALDKQNLPYIWQSMKCVKYAGSAILLLSMLCASFNSYGQRGGRVGIIMGAAAVGLGNANDDAAPDSMLARVPTKGFQRGVEVGYSWRYFGIGAQIMGSQFGQNYKVGQYSASTRLNYLRPTVVLTGTTNTKNDVRATIQIGGYYGALLNYTEQMRGVNPSTGVIDEVNITNTTYTQTGSQNINGTLSKGIYYNSDAGIMVAAGGEFRFKPHWLVGLQFRYDMGMEALENYETSKLTYDAGNTTIKQDYAHWQFMPYKYRYESFYNGVRTPSSNGAMGAYLSLRYVIQSNTVLMYEMDGY
jgi:hypothetical protein